MRSTLHSIALSAAPSDRFSLNTRGYARPDTRVRGKKRGVERLTGMLVKSTCSGTMHTNSSVRHDTHSLERTSENITHEPLRAGVDTGDLGTPQSVLSGGWTQIRRLLTSVEIWVTRAALGSDVRALPVRLTPRLYIELVRAARASSPVVMERQKNYERSVLPRV